MPIYLQLSYLLDELTLLSLDEVSVSYSFCLKVYFVFYKYSYLCSLLVSICMGYLSHPSFFIFYFIYLCIWLHWVLVVVRGIFFFFFKLRHIRSLTSSMWTLSFSLWDLVPWSGIEPGPPALRAQTLRHWKVSWTEEPSKLQSIRWQTVGHDWRGLARTSTRVYTGICMYIHFTVYKWSPIEKTGKSYYT